MKTKKLAIVTAILALGFNVANAQVRVGFSIGTYAPRPVYVERPYYHPVYYRHPVVVEDSYPVYYRRYGYAYRRPYYRHVYYRHAYYRHW